VLVLFLDVRTYQGKVYRCYSVKQIYQMELELSKFFKFCQILKIIVQKKSLESLLILLTMIHCY